MAIQGQQTINVGYPNEAAGSDSLYTAFNKVKTNFETLFACSSPYSTVTGNTGIIVNANSTQGTVDIFNVGVVGLVAGTGIALSGTSNGGVYTGQITISATGVIGTVSSVGITSTTLQVSGSPITSSGNINVDIPPDLTLSGNVIANSVTVAGANLGSVDNLSITGGSANYVLSTDGSGGLSWVAQTGGGGGGSSSNIYNGTSNVSINSSGGNITAGVGGTANVVTITNAGLDVTGALSSTGNANVGNLGAAGIITATGTITGGNITATGNARVSGLGGLVVTGNIASSSSSNAAQSIYALNSNTGTSAFAGVGSFNDSGVSIRLIAFGSNYVPPVGQPPTANLGGLFSGASDMPIVFWQNATERMRINSTGNVEITNTVTANDAAITGNLTVGGVSGGYLTGANSVSANYFTGTLTTNAQPNITSVGTLSSLSVSGNANVGNIGSNNGVFSNAITVGSATGGSITGANLISANNFTSLISFTSNGSMQLAASLSQEGGTPVSSANSVITHKIPIVINGTTYYIALTAAQ